MVENRDEQETENRGSDTEEQTNNLNSEDEALIVTSKDKFRITVEFPIFLAMVGSALSGTVLYNIVLYRTCIYGLGYGKDECRPFLGHHRQSVPKDLEEQVQQYSIFINTVKSVMESIVPAFMSFYLGSWSDRYGRKPLITWPILGMSLSWALIVVYVMMENLGPWWFLLTSIPFSLSGGISILFTGAYCYISDITNNENRSFRMTLVDATVSVALFVGFISSSYLLSLVGNVYLLLIATSLFVIAYVFSNLCIKESVSNQEQGSISSVFDFSLVKEMFHECIKERPNHGRPQILLLIFATTLCTLIGYGLMNLDYMYARKRIHWAMSDFTIYSATNTAIVFVGNFIGTLVLQKYLGLSDIAFAIISFLSAISEYVVKIFAEETWHMYLGAVISIFKGLSLPLIRSVVTIILPPGDMAKILSLMGALTGICPLFSPLIYNSLYVVTVTTFPISIYVFSIGLTAVSIILLGFVQYYNWSAPVYTQLDKSN